MHIALGLSPFFLLYIFICVRHIIVNLIAIIMLKEEQWLRARTRTNLDSLRLVGQSWTITHMWNHLILWFTFTHAIRKIWMLIATNRAILILFQSIVGYRLPEKGRNLYRYTHMFIYMTFLLI